MKTKTRTGSSRFGLSLLIVSAVGLAACSDSADPVDNGPAGAGAGSGGGGAAATGGAGSMETAGTPMGGMETAGSPVAGSTMGGAGGSPSIAGGTAGNTAAAAGASGMGGGGGTASGGGAAGASGMEMMAGASGMETAGMETGGMGMETGGMGMETAGASSGDEDIDMTPDDFSCIGDWDQVSGFRITNLLGHLEEALAVANNPEGGVYPVGTVIQHLPTEAMVKRATGWSPETRDWEFFLLSLSPDGVTTITERGTTELTTMGNTCVSCHALAPEQFDFVCNIWGDQGGACGNFDFTQSFLEQQLAGDTRCE